VKRIAILGASVASQNRGVLALGASVVGLCKALHPDAEVLFVCGHHEHGHLTVRLQHGATTVPIVPVRMHPRASVGDHLFAIALASALFRCIPSHSVRRLLAARVPFIATIASADAVGDIRGGDSFSDIYGLKRFILASVVSLSVLLVRGRIAFLPQTYGPFGSSFGRFLARLQLKRASVILARDANSALYAQKLCPAARSIRTCPDVAFSLPPIRPAVVRTTNGAVLDLAAVDGCIGLNISGLLYRGGYNESNMFGLSLDYRQFVRDLLKTLLDQGGDRLWLIPHTYGAPGSIESDTEASVDAVRSLSVPDQARIHCLAPEYDQHELKAVIGRLGFFTGARMHACIAALSQSVPCVGIAYSMKFKGVFEDAGVGDAALDARTLSTSRALLAVMDLYKRREALANTLRQQVPDTRRRLEAEFGAFTEMDSRRCTRLDPSRSAPAYSSSG
jgi:colanic acid/amylovoran biosynthesis protein